MTPKEKINKILSTFGMTNVRAAQIIGIKKDTFNKNNSAKALNHKFNEKNYQDLVDYIKKEAKKL